jgi:hypothetical protein
MNDNDSQLQAKTDLVSVKLSKHVIPCLLVCKQLPESKSRVHVRFNVPDPNIFFLSHIELPDGYPS